MTPTVLFGVILVGFLGYAVAVWLPQRLYGQRWLRHLRDIAPEAVSVVQHVARESRIPVATLVAAMAFRLRAKPTFDDDYQALARNLAWRIHILLTELKYQSDASIPPAVKLCQQKALKALHQGFLIQAGKHLYRDDDPLSFLKEPNEIRAASSRQQGMIAHLCHNIPLMVDFYCQAVEQETKPLKRLSYLKELIKSLQSMGNLYTEKLRLKYAKIVMKYLKKEVEALSKENLGEEKTIKAHQLLAESFFMLGHLNEEAGFVWAVNAYDAAFSLMDPDENPKEWKNIRQGLGAALLNAGESYRGAVYLKRAIGLYEACLEDSVERSEWVRLHFNRSWALFLLSGLYEAVPPVQAIEAFEALKAALCPEKDGLEIWAYACRNLALSYGLDFSHTYNNHRLMQADQALDQGLKPLGKTQTDKILREQLSLTRANLHDLKRRL